MSSSPHLENRPTHCPDCQRLLSPWQSQLLCKECGAAFALVRNERAETLAMLWFFAGVGLFAFVPLWLALAHLAFAFIGCSMLAIKLRRQHRWMRVESPPEF